MRFAELLEGVDAPPPTARKLLHDRYRWAAHSGDPPLRLLTADGFDRFRASALAAGYSRRTIESTISDVIYVARRHGIELKPGRRLRIPRPQPSVPSLGSIARVYLTTESATYPRRSWASPAAWWRCLLVVALWCGFRRGDLARLSWDDIGPWSMELRASKTGKLHRIPLTSTVQRHLAQLDHLGHPLRIFDLPRSTSFRAFGDQLARLCLAARVPALTLQGIRRASITMWSSVNAEAGRIIHGCHLGIMAHYLDPLAILQAAAPLVQLPDVMLTREERRRSARNRRELIDLYARAGADGQRIILEVARRVVR